MWLHEKEGYKVFLKKQNNFIIHIILLYKDINLEGSHNKTVISINFSFIFLTKTFLWCNSFVFNQKCICVAVCIMTSWYGTKKYCFTLDKIHPADIMTAVLCIYTWCVSFIFLFFFTRHLLCISCKWVSLLKGAQKCG